METLIVSCRHSSNLAYIQLDIESALDVQETCLALFERPQRCPNFVELNLGLYHSRGINADEDGIQSYIRALGSR